MLRLYLRLIFAPYFVMSIYALYHLTSTGVALVEA